MENKSMTQEDFILPEDRQELYLDWAASSLLCPPVARDLESYFRENFANPSAAHSLSKNELQFIEQSKNSIRSACHLNSDYQVIFTSGATEANNMLIKGLNLNDGNILYCLADHSSVVAPTQVTSKNITHFSLKPGGMIDREDLLQKAKKAKLVILTHVNNQSGVINLIEELACDIKKENPNIHIHIDAAQGFARLPLDGSHFDSITVSAHKLYGPKGIGTLILAPRVKIKALLHGGNQQAGLRSGTLPTPLIRAFGQAVSFCQENRNLEHYYSLKKNLEEKLKSHPNVKFPFKDTSTSPYILTFIIQGFPSEVILRVLEKEKIYLSMGSACNSFNQDTLVLKTLGINKKDYSSVLRLSFGYDFDFKMIDLFVGKLFATLRQLDVYL